MFSIQASYQAKKQVKSDLTTLFFSLTKVLETKLALPWHIQSLDRYIQEDISTIGLRILISPILDHITKHLKNNWENKLNECSKNLMMLLQNE